MRGVFRTVHTHFGVRIHLLVCSLLLLVLGTSCKAVFTSDYFRMGVKSEKFPMSSQVIQVRQKVVSKPIDILFVVDNSGSMSNNQAALAAAFSGFSNKYIKGAEWDLSISIITTDTYLAGTGGRPVNYSTLAVGIHDGPRPSLGANPRSGKPLLSTLPPAGTLADNTWINQLVTNLEINSKPGTNGSSQESGMLSIISFIESNEKAACLTAGSTIPCLFRKNSTRVIIPFSDEVDNCATTNSLCALYPNDAVTPANSRPAKTKLALDQFFKALDGLPGAPTNDPNYFMVALVDTSGAAISNTLSNVFYPDLVAAVKADTTNSLAHLSASNPLESGNVSAVLDTLGTTLGQFTSVAEQRYSAFTLALAPNSKDDIIVIIVTDAGVATVLGQDKWSLDGNILLLSKAYADTLPGNYSIEIQYNPKLR